MKSQLSEVTFNKINFVHIHSWDGNGRPLCGRGSRLELLFFLQSVFYSTKLTSMSENFSFKHSA